MLIRFWGVRGSISAPGRSTMRYGGNTPCVEARGDAGVPIILDAGYGIVGLGNALVAESSKTVHLLLSHLHWDHIQGLPFFVPFYMPGKRIIIYSANVTSSRQALERLFTSVYSPIMGVENLDAEIEYRTIAGPLDLDGVEVTPIGLHHSVPTLGFRLVENGRSVCYATDHEAGETQSNRHLLEIARGVDVLIHDAHHTAKEYRTHIGWGHSHTATAVENARKAGARRLFLFHYDPTHDDEAIDRQLLDARRLASGSALKVDASAEGMTVEL